MHQLKTIYSDYSSCCNDFIVGIDYLNQRAISKALSHFLQACRLTSRQDCHFNIYQSYLGLVNVLSGEPSGLTLCQRATESGEAEGDLYLNLARAEWFCCNRQATVEALHKGLETDNSHAGLNEMLNHLGIRRSNPIAFLPRQHYLNRLLGKMLRKK